MCLPVQMRTPVDCLVNDVAWIVRTHSPGGTNQQERKKKENFLLYLNAGLGPTQTRTPRERKKNGREEPQPLPLSLSGKEEKKERQRKQHRAVLRVPTTAGHACGASACHGETLQRQEASSTAACAAGKSRVTPLCLLLANTLCVFLNALRGAHVFMARRQQKTKKLKRRFCPPSFSFSSSRAVVTCTAHTRRDLHRRQTPPPTRTRVP